MDCCPISNFIRRRRKEARPGELVAAAMELFVEKGFAATRLEDIAARAGVSKGTIYLYFEGKEALFKAAVEAGVTPAIVEAEALITESDRPAPELLRELIERSWTTLDSSYGGIPKLMACEGNNFPELARWYYEHTILRAREVIHRVIAIGIQRGEFRPEMAQLNPDVIFSPLMDLVLMRHSFGAIGIPLPDTQTYLRQVIDLLLHGLCKEKA
jgi:AcrR family transcriptional regulator